jgi:hypothetical protein
MKESAVVLCAVLSGMLVSCNYVTQTESGHHAIIGTWEAVVDKEDFHFTYYDRKTIRFSIHPNNTFDKFLINTDDVYSFSGERHYSIDDTTVYSGTWFSETKYGGELIAAEAVKLLKGGRNVILTNQQIKWPFRIDKDDENILYIKNTIFTRVKEEGLIEHIVGNKTHPTYQ